MPPSTWSRIWLASRLSSSVSLSTMSSAMLASGRYARSLGQPA